MSSHFSAQALRTHARRLPPSYWSKVWAAWCPSCQQEAMPLSSGCCGWCDTDLYGQPTRGPYDPPLVAPCVHSTINRHNHLTAVAA